MTSAGRPMGFFRNPRSAFMFQAVVGLVSLISVLTMGRTGLALVAFLGVRPFLFGRSPSATDDALRSLYRRTFRISLAILAAFLAAVWLAPGAGLTVERDRWMLLLLVVPAFMTIHGITGFLLAGPDGPAGASAPPTPGDRGTPL